MTGTYKPIVRLLIFSGVYTRETSSVSYCFVAV